MKYPRPYFVFIFFFLITVSTNQTGFSQATNNSLLWRISGNGLKKSSFLFGTIHVQDRRVFNFSDSLYNSLNTVEGFAMEVHPDSMAQAIFDMIGKQDQKLLKESMQKKDYEKIKGKIKQKYGVDPEKLTISQARALKKKSGDTEKREDDMPSIVDLYLYSIAKDQGKQIQGLEQMDDQIMLFEDIQNSFQSVDFTNELPDENKFLEKMIQKYKAEDLNGIKEMVSLMDEESQEKVLINRNRLMADKIDTLVRELSYFTAIGVAHLPGSTGVIELLRQKGYLVEPVISQTKLPAGSYTYKKNNKWNLFADPQGSYEVMMPGMVMPVNTGSQGFILNAHLDLTRMKMYYISSLPVSPDKRTINPDTLLQLFANQYMKSQKVKSTERKYIIVKDSLKCVELITKEASSDYWMRLQIILFANKVYIVGVGSQKVQELSEADSEYYFSMFTPVNEKQSFTLHQFDDHGFEVRLPGKVEQNKINNQDSTISAYQFHSVDAEKGIFYIVLKSSANPTFIISSDSVYFNSIAEGLKTNLGYSIQYSADTIVGKNKAKVFNAIDPKTNVICKALSIKRGSQVFTLIAIADKVGVTESTEIQAFFNSFNILPYQAKNWNKQMLPDHSIETWGPGNIVIKNNSSEFSESKQSGYYMYDPEMAVTYDITSDTLNSFYFSHNDTALLHTWMSEYVFESHPLISYRYFHHGRMPAVEVVTRVADSRTIKKVWILLNGYVKYSIIVFMPEEFMEEKNQLRLFNELRFIESKDPGIVLHQKPSKLFDSLTSKDSVSAELAYNALTEVSFTKQNFTDLLGFALLNYPADSLHYTSTNERLFNIMEGLVDASHINLMKASYLSIKPDQADRYFNLLELMAAINTKESYEAILSLMESKFPSGSNPNDFLLKLRDSLALTKIIYPLLLTHAADSNIALPLFRIHSLMLEAKMVSNSDLVPYEHLIEKAVSDIYSSLMQNPETKNWWYTYNLIETLGKLDNPKWDEWLNRFLSVAQHDIQLVTALKLIEKNKPVPKKIWQELAADSKIRLELYRSLKEQKKINLFPETFLNQRAFSESLLWENFDDEEPDEIQFIEEQEALYNGKKFNFFLYKVIFKYEGETSTYLGISGPFDLRKKVIYPEDHISGTYSVEEYTPGFTKKMLALYLQQFEETEVAK